jgi:hypothetical protein
MRARVRGETVSGCRSARLTVAIEALVSRATRRKVTGLSGVLGTSSSPVAVGP